MQNHLIFIARLVAAANGDKTRELRVVSQWEEGQQGESDHKRLLERNQHGEDASAGDWQGPIALTIVVVDHAHQLFT